MRPPMDSGRTGGGGRDSCPEKKEKEKDPTSRLCSDLSDLQIEKIASTPTFQWISVYNKRPPMKQRFHHNVLNSRLHHHVEKANKDGLFISCVASEANLWAFVVDKGTGFTSQVYKVTSVFLPKDWIMKQWEKNYYISSIAGANNGGSLVVMSKGTLYTKQSYKTSDSIPLKWMDKKWKEGFHVTSMATAGSSWGVVMSRNSGFSEQVMELDFLNPSEDINRRLESGYRITSMAATADQAALILSIPKRKITDEIQETLRTSSFPSSYVKDKWAKNMFITSICYGVIPTCVLCHHQHETRDHLYFSCKYSKEIWTTIWRERNGRKHGEKPTPPTTLVTWMDKQIRNKLSVIRKEGDTRYEPSLQAWFASRSL